MTILLKSWARRINIISGNREGGLKAVATIKAKHGEDFYSRIGKKGGSISRGGGFTGDPERARAAGRKGGRAKAKNMRKKKLNKENK